MKLFPSKDSKRQEGDFTVKDMTELAQVYRMPRLNLNQLHEYLPQRKKDKFYDYFVEVTEYEKKVLVQTMLHYVTFIN